MEKLTGITEILPIDLIAAGMNAEKMGTAQAIERFEVI
jgi:hypothetical protein